jgi:hypothetical protein
MEYLNYLFSMAAWWIWMLAAAVAGALVYLNRHSFGVTEFLYTLPLIGRLARFSKDYSESNSQAGWLNVENTLCRDYARHCTAISQEEFDNNILYLKKTYDHGRREIPMWVIGMLGLLVMMEALGFSYILGGLMAAEASENIRTALMVGIVLVLATILIWVTHQAGHQYFRTSLLRHCFREFQKDKRPDRAFSSEIVSLDQDQHVDDAQPTHVQCVNRVINKPGDLGNHAWAWIAGVLVVTIAVGSIVLRVDAMHVAQAEMADSSVAAMPGGGEAAAAADPALADPAAMPDPAAAPAASPPPAAAAAAPQAAKENAALMGFIMLAIIFVVTQMVGVGVGLRYGFAGKQSKLAHKATNGHAEYGSYFAPVEQKMMIANARLLKLHQLLEKHSPTPIDFPKDFFHFVQQEKARGATYLQMPPPERGRTAPAGAAAARANGHAADGMGDAPGEIAVAADAFGEAQQPEGQA